MNRRWLITLSLLAHVGLGIFLFATGVWKIEKLDGGRATISLAVMLPLAEPEGGPPPGEKPKDRPKRDQETKKLVEDVVQPEVKPAETAPVTATTSDVDGIGSGSGNGSGSGSGSGTGSGSGSCVGDDCVGDSAEILPVCGDRVVESGESCDDGNLAPGDGCSAVCTTELVLLPPKVLQGLRISGETQIVPPDTVKTEMLRDGTNRVLGTLKLCIATDGRISSVSVLRSTKYPAYDARLVAGARAWRYAAYRVNRRPVPACSTVTFVYTIE